VDAEAAEVAVTGAEGGLAQAALDIVSGIKRCCTAPLDAAPI